MKKKLKDSAGFSLVEMLCAVVILVLLCLMLNSGLSVAVKSYFDITAESETQLLLNSLTNAIAGELRYAYEVTGTGDSTTSPRYNGGLYLDWSSGQVLVKDEAGGATELLPKEKEDTGKGGAYRDGSYTVEHLEITPTAEKNDKNEITGYYFTLHLKVKNASRGISAENSVVIRCLNPPKEETPPGGGTS